MAHNMPVIRQHITILFSFLTLKPCVKIKQQEHEHNLNFAYQMAHDMPPIRKLKFTLN